MNEHQHQVLLIADFGSQVTQLIARRFRELNIYCEIHPAQAVDDTMLRRLSPVAVVLSGGPASVVAKSFPKLPDSLFELGVPMLGICYGQQVMARQLGGSVAADGEHGEYGRTTLKSTGCNDGHPLLRGLFADGTETVWMSHADRVVALPPGFVALAESENAPYAIVGDTTRSLFGFQFHPEVYHTPNGSQFLRNFADLAGFRRDWTVAAVRDSAIASIQAQVGSGKVICALSGGVDSCVTALLLHRAIPGRTKCVFVDHGLLREGEAEQVVGLFRDNFNMPLIAVDESRRFLRALAGIVDPERKRRIIGKLFIEVFSEIAREIKSARYLAQGTLYPDVIESVSVSG
ncbi:MAG: glutamine-hydrolyzing GMP synthase, partial [Rhodobacteraceae bacterium]|nr:glutamine-hydrolyzing GMP synthase [Paracoccaceae bacterium]